MYNYQNSLELISISGTIIIIIMISISLIIIFSPIIIINQLKKINKRISNVESILLEQNNILLNILNKNEQKKED